MKQSETVYDWYPILWELTEDEPGAPCRQCHRPAHGDGIGPAVLVDGEPMHPWCAVTWRHAQQDRRERLRAFQRTCPHCGQPPGSGCVSVPARRPRFYFHAVRRRAS